MKLFDRVVELTVGETEITGLDIAFEIEKDENPEPNPCHIEIYNLGPGNRAILSKYKRVPVVLKAGYQGQVGILFQGDMVRVSHLKEGASWKTILACGDGASVQGKRTQKTYTKGTPLKTVIEDLAQQAGLPANSPMDHLEELNKTLSRTIAVSGNPMAEVTRLLSSQNIKVSVQNQALQLRKKNEPLQKEALVLSSDTGLLASPEIGSKGKVMIRSLLMAALIPGRKVQVVSAMLNAFLRIEHVRFSGSNFTQDWEAEMECKAQ
jgi:hypothetical protein